MSSLVLGLEGKRDIEVLFGGWSSHKVAAFDVHPLRPLLVTAHDNANITIWDTQSEKILHEFSLYSFPNHGVGEEKYTQEKLGGIKFVKFFDNATKSARPFVLRGLTRLLKSGRNEEHHSESRTLEFSRYLIISTEYRLLFFDYVSYQIRDIKLSILENKSQLCAEFWTNSSPHLVCFGGSDGIVRIWNCEKWKLSRRLPGGQHPKGIVDLFCYEHDSKYHVISGGGEGRICLWDITNAVLKQSAKAHDGSLLNLSYNPLTSQVMSIGSDKTIAVWNIYNLQPISRYRVKHSLTGAKYFAHPFLPQNAVIGYVKDNSKVYWADLRASDRDSMHLFDLTSLPKISKKTKILNMTVHPLQPHQIICITNYGAMIVSFEPRYLMKHVVHNQKVYYVNDGYIHCLAIPPSSEATKVFQIPASMPTLTDIALSPSGRYLSLFSSTSFMHVIVDTTTWKIIEEVTSKCFCWASTNDRYAIVELVKPVEDPKKKKLSRRGKRISVPPEEVFRIKEIDSNSNVVVRAPVVPLTNRIETLWSGRLLGVSCDTGEERKLPRDGSQPRVEGATKAVIQLLDWDTFTPVAEIPQPKKIFWDPLGVYVALVFKRWFSVHLIQPVFKQVCRYHYTVVSALWVNNCLFFSTHTDIRCIFPNEENSAPIVLASYHNFEPLPDELLTPELSGCEDQKPVGALSLLEFQDDKLMVFDHKFKIHSIDVSHPVIRFYMLAAAGKIKDALEWASLVHPNFYTSFASFLESRGYAEEALKFCDGVSLFFKLNLCIKNKLFDEALEFLQLLTDEVTSGPTNSEAVQRLIGAAKHIAQLALSEKEYRCAVEALLTVISLDDNLYIDLIELYVELEEFVELKYLSEKLNSEQKHWYAKLAASFVDDTEFLCATLQVAKDLASATTISVNDTASALLAEWNSQLSQSCGHDHIAIPNIAVQLVNE